ncbi:MAG: hypothetical protein ACE5KT_10385 [Methanosarcinales archaeon]
MSNPNIIKLNKTYRGNSIPIEGKKLKDVLPYLKREVLDVMVEITFKKRKYKGKQTTITQLFRLVAVLNKKTGKYHLYITNIHVDRLFDCGLWIDDFGLIPHSAFRIPQSKDVFKKLKSHYHMNQIQSDPHISSNN